jgi:non-specific protein-tyrosine kinase
MGRIEDALKRTKRIDDPVDDPRPAAGERAEAPFVSPWHGGESPSEGPHPPRLKPRAKLRSGEHTRGPVRAEHTSSLQLDSQLAMGWPQPFSPDVAAKVVVMRETNAAAVDQYRKLAETVRQSTVDRGTKSVLVTSAVAGEGKTLTAVNLALTLSQLKGRVLLVDANPRHPQVHSIFQVSAGSGLGGCLKASDVVPLPVIDVTPTLALLPAGVSGFDASALGSDAMKRVLAEARERFQWVVIDGPPVVSVSGTGLLAELVDSAILVVHAGRTSQDQVTQAVETVGRARILGAVLNRAGRKAVAEDARQSGLVT